MQKANYIGFDLETGGFSEKRNPITELAMIALDGNTLKEKDRIEFYIQPYDNLVVEKEALTATGLKFSDIKNGYEKKKAFKMIKDFAYRNSINKSPRNLPILFAHNSKFDEKFLREFFVLNNTEFTKVFNETLICTQQWSKAFTGENVKLTLGECCKRVGIELVDAHKAMNDTAAMVKLFQFYVKSLRKVEAIEKESTETETKTRTKFQF